MMVDRKKGTCFQDAGFLINHVIPAQAGIQSGGRSISDKGSSLDHWTPASAGVTIRGN